MSCPAFKIGGALTDEHDAIYIERQADREALTHVRALDYLLVIEPRQQGKTSLINHLMCHPATQGVAFVYVDVTTPDRSSEATWYRTLCPRILRQMGRFIPREQEPVIPQNSAGWREFLCDVAMFAAHARRRVVIALDEIGAVTFPGATEFFSVLRDVYNSRQAETEFKQLTFLLSGAFHPRNLIQDDKISPFNIAQRVRLADFMLAQVRELVGKGNWRDVQATALAERIHYWTDGQPYLTQLLCAYLGPDATPADVDDGVERLRREDENHLPPMLERLKGDEKLCRYIGRILEGERIKFYPRENRRQAQLELLGVIKADSEGCCAIRNRIYLQALGVSVEVPKPGRGVHMRSSDRIGSSAAVPQELVEQLGKGNVVLFVGAGLSIGAGLPGWGALVRPLAERISYTGDELLKAAQYYENRNGRHALISYLRDRLDTVGIEPTANHNLLTRLPVNIVFTTNFDDLLERAYRKAGRQVNLVVEVTELPFWDESRVNLVKLHGTYDRPDSFVITEQDYHTIYRSNALVMQQLNALLATKTFLFIGYSVSDPDFNQIYDQLRIDLGRHQRRPYLVTFDVDQFTREDLERRGYHVISLLGEGNRDARLAQWLRALLDAVTGKTPEGEVSSSSVRPPSSGPPEHQSPRTTRPRRRENMNFKLGLDVLKRYAGGTDWQDDFDMYEAQLRKVLHDQRRYGPGLQSSQDQWRIVENLNILARDHLDISFNDLCMGEQPRIKRLDRVGDQDIAALIQELKAIVLEANTAEREASERLWQAVQQDRVEQGEIASMVDALRRWAQSVQKAGLPVDADLRAAILSLAQPTEGVDGMYNYLHFALPLLPGLLSIESEIDLNKLWAEIKDRWGSKKDAVPTEPGKTEKKGAKGDGSSLASAKPVLNTGRAWAVLVGVNTYEDSYIANLKVCVDDVTAIHQVLVPDYQIAKLLTDVTPERLPTRANILGELSAVAQNTSEGDLLLFYFSGHGVAEGGESYLLVRDTRLSALKHTAVAMRDVRELMEGSPARAKVIVLDACHSGASIGKAAAMMTPEFIRRVFEEAEGMAVLASCKQGQQSWEWRDKGRSVFTYYLLEALTGKADFDPQKGFVTVSDVSRYVTDGVKAWAAREGVPQTPTLQYTVAGDIVLKSVEVKAQPEKTSLDNGTLALSRVVISVPLPESAWSKFCKRAETRGKSPERYLDLLIEMECEQTRPGSDRTVKLTFKNWPVQDIEIDSLLLERFKGLRGAASEQWISWLIQEAIQG